MAEYFQQLGILGILVFIVSFITSISEKKIIHPAAPPPQEAEGDVKKKFSWQLKSAIREYLLNFTVIVNSQIYNEAAAALLEDPPPNKTKMYSDSDCCLIAQQQILHEKYGLGSSELEQVISYLKEYRDQEYLSNYEYTNIILSFVHEQCIRYQYDLDSKGTPEYFRFPVETIYDTVGDCDCKSILACSLFKALGYRVAFALMPGHAALALRIENELSFSNILYNGEPWYYCESTGDSWQPGVVPDGIDLTNINLYEI